MFDSRRKPSTQPDLQADAAAAFAALTPEDKVAAIQYLRRLLAEQAAEDAEAARAAGA